MTYHDPNNFEQTEIPEDDQPIQSNPERHGCVTTWLIIMLILNSFVALFYSISVNKLAQSLNTSKIAIMGLVLLGALNIIFAIMLLTWRKIGFYGFVITTIAAFSLNIYIGISPARATLGLLGFAVLYGILQIKQNGISAWSYLK